MIQASDPSEIIHGEIADYWYAPNGILYSYSKNPKRTIENIRQNIALVKKITSNQRVPMLIYLCDSPVPDQPTRQFSAEQIPTVYKAMAMVSAPGLSQLIMKLVFMFKPPAIPMKSFTDDLQAQEWLKQYV